MKNKITRISPERKQELRELIDLIQQESYKQGYEDGKFVQSVDNVEQIHDKWLAEKEPKTPNQHRAELIKKAKRFVEDIIGSYDTFSMTINGYKNQQVKPVFQINENKRAVTVLIYGAFSKDLLFKGLAKCIPGDVFNEWIGKAIALARALQIDIPVEFLEAVQPSEVVVGHKVRGNYAKKTYEVPAFHSREHLGGMFGRSIAIEGINSRAWVGEKQVKIIDDTNAQYEVGE